MDEIKPDLPVEIQFIKCAMEVNPSRQLMIVDNRHGFPSMIVHIGGICSIIAIEDKESPYLGVLEVVVKDGRIDCLAVGGCERREESYEPKPARRALKLSS